MSTVHMFSIPVKAVRIYRRTTGTDKIAFVTDSAHAEKIHQNFLYVFEEAPYNLEVTRGRGEEVCQALGIPSDIVTLITFDGMQKVKW